MGTECVQLEQKTTQLKLSEIRGPHRFDISQRTKNHVSKPKSTRVLAVLQDEFKILSEKAKLVLLPFSTTYPCEAGFSAYRSTKTQYRSRLNAELDIRLQLSSIEPKIRKLCKKCNHSCLIKRLYVILCNVLILAYCCTTVHSVCTIHVVIKIKLELSSIMNNKDFE